MKLSTLPAPGVFFFVLFFCFVFVLFCFVFCLVFIYLFVFSLGVVLFYLWGLKSKNGRVT